MICEECKKEEATVVFNNKKLCIECYSKLGIKEYNYEAI
jgi:ribosomal protein L40E